MESLGVMILTLALGTPILSLIGSIGVGLTISLKTRRPVAVPAGISALRPHLDHRNRRGDGSLG